MPGLTTGFKLTAFTLSQVGRIEERSDVAPAARRPLHQGKRCRNGASLGPAYNLASENGL
jgi:hypothetical protein